MLGALPILLCFFGFRVLLVVPSLANEVMLPEFAYYILYSSCLGLRCADAHTSHVNISNTVLHHKQQQTTKHCCFITCIINETENVCMRW